MMPLLPLMFIAILMIIAWATLALAKSKHKVSTYEFKNSILREIHEANKLVSSLSMSSYSNMLIIAKVDKIYSRMIEIRSMQIEESQFTGPVIKKIRRLRMRYHRKNAAQ